ncbi:MAG: DUF512 domain-containing protein [Eubacteriales bacterium]
MKKEHIVKLVEEESIAWEMGIESGDKLIQINNTIVEDIFDYQFLVHDELVTLLIEKKNGEEWEIEIEKEYGEELGIEFEQGLMDEYRSCKNKCVFCFIDQMPPGMRETLYFKDDDSRLSFLQGNYITLTNMSEQDIQRIVKYHLGPINISIHAMNPELRCKMLNNRFAGEALKKIDTLYEGGIEMNGQIVLCPDLNDGEELEYSIQEMGRYFPNLQSVSIVPVGLTKYRVNLYELRSFTKEEAKKVLHTIHKWQDTFYEQYGQHFIQAGDEWYILAEEAFPEATRYDGYLQLENGVGMVRLLLDEFMEALDRVEGDDRHRHITVVTAVLMYPIMNQLAEWVREKFPNIHIEVVQIVNKFFGEQITVTGLITGQDLIAQLQGKELGDCVLLPCNVLRTGEAVFLDDITLEEVKDALQVKVDIVKSSGYDVLDSIIRNN